MIQHADDTFIEILLQGFNQILMEGNFNESENITILAMMPTDGDLGELINLRPIALLLIFY